MGQMLLANALSIHFFGRGYRRRDAVPGVPGGDARARDPHDGLLSWFGDHPDANACPFSIHEVYRWGRGELDDAAEKKPGGVPGVVPGRWLGPCVTAQAMAALTNARRPGGMCAYVLADEDGTFGGGAPNLDARKVAAFASEKARQLRGLRSNGDRPSPKRTGLRLPGAPFDARAEDAVRNDAKEERAKKTEDWAPTLVLVPLVLGIDRHVNARYVTSVAATLRVKQSLGVLGGTPGSSLYVVGAQDDRLFYLDPHTVFPFAESRNAGRFEIADVSTYACDDALHMDARELDPSMVLGFYCRARGDLDELCLELELLQRRAGAAPLLTVASARANARGGGNDDPTGIQQGETAPEPGSAPTEPVLSAPTRETKARGADLRSDDEWEFL